MYFDIEKTARINDSFGNIIPWIPNGTSVVYVSARLVKITGTLTGECYVMVDSIQ